MLFVSDSAAPLTGAELARLRAAVEGCPMTVFVQTKIDACAGLARRAEPQHRADARRRA